MVVNHNHRLVEFSSKPNSKEMMIDRSYFKYGKNSSLYTTICSHSLIHDNELILFLVLTKDTYSSFDCLVS